MLSTCSAIASQLSMSHVIKLCAAVGIASTAAVSRLDLPLASAIIHFGYPEASHRISSHIWQSAACTHLRHEKKFTLAIDSLCWVLAPYPTPSRIPAPSWITFELHSQRWHNGKWLCWHCPIAKQIKQTLPDMATPRRLSFSLPVCVCVRVCQLCVCAAAWQLDKVKS